MESIFSEVVPFGGLNPPDVNNSKWGNPEPEKWVPEIHFFQPMRLKKNLLNSTMKLFFKYDQKWRRYQLWQTHKCVGGGLCCPEKFRKFSTRVEPEQKNGGITGILHTAYRKTFCCRPVVPVESVHSESVPFGGLNYQISRTPKWGNPKFFLDLGFRKFISFTLSDIEKFAEFNSEIIFRIRLKVMQWCKADPWIGL